MARHEPAGRQDAGAPPGLKIRMRLDPDGKARVVMPESEQDAERRDDERPRGDEPRDATRGPGS
jgi:hypothetical protein